MSLAHSPSTILPGLVLCLDAANTKSYPGSGTTWTDLSGRGNNGTLTNGPTYSSANGGSIVFDGLDDYVGSSQFSSLLTTTSGTIEIWFKILSTPNQDYEGLCGFSGSGGTRSVWIETAEISTDIVRFIWRLSSGSLGAIGSNINPSTNRNINHLVGTYQVVSTNITFSFYVNGNLVSSSSPVGSLTDTPTGLFEIGRNFNSSAYINANAYSVKLYNRALTASEIQQNFNALRGRYGI